MTTIPRPRVESFEITVTPPEYTQLPIRQFSAETADLAALEGSKVSVSLNTTPSAAELRGQVHWLSRSTPWKSNRTEPSAVSDLVPNQSLSIDSKQTLFVNFSADGDREFKFDLQHLTSGIKNDFSPTYRLAGALFGLTLVGIIKFCILPFLQRPQWSSLASDMERLCPPLRNQLLSAVELARQPLVNDSIAFRHQVQRSAAVAVGPVNVAKLLPSRLIRKPLLVGFASTLAIVLLCFVPQLKMPQRLLRVLLPWANIGRITFVSIHIESPDVYGDSSRLIFPRGEMTGVVARIEGPKPRQVFLEWRGV